ncbi:MAG TPA: glutamine synthetase family protein, partial [Nonomuraea sp.]|nr:glutamine synthetase family protein [Nonomuraea sp.]
GASTTFSVFTGLDAMGSAHGLDVPTGDLRLVADLDAHVVDGAWAWAPADLVDTDGAPWPTCARTFARRMEDAATHRGLRLQASFESEFTAWHGDGSPLHEQPAYGVEATRASGPFLLAIVRRLQALGVEVDQVHPEYSPGQLEVSVGRTGAVAAADRVVLVRDVIRTVARELGLRVSFSAKPSPESLGNGAHLHLSLWNDTQNLFADDSELRECFIGGLIAHLPALTALTCGSVNSFRRLAPRTWASAYAVYGPDNREAAIRICSPLGESGEPNLELKPSDSSANPYLSLGAVIHAGLDGIRRKLDPGEAVDVDPDTRPGRYQRLPASLEEALDALEADELLMEALGPLRRSAYLAVKRSEAAAFAAQDASYELFHHMRVF